MDTTLFPAEGLQHCPTAADTQTLAARMGAALQCGDVVILDGPLGAGKTTFTQGLARGMNVAGRVTSPTFVIAREHRPKNTATPNAPTLIHVDAYRLLGDHGTDAAGALDSLDLDTDLSDAVIVAEWGKGLVEYIADTWIAVTIDRTTAVAQDPLSEERIISWKQKTH